MLTKHLFKIWLRLSNYQTPLYTIVGTYRVWVLSLSETYPQSSLHSKLQSWTALTVLASSRILAAARSANAASPGASSFSSTDDVIAGVGAQRTKQVANGRTRTHPHFLSFSARFPIAGLEWDGNFTTRCGGGIKGHWECGGLGQSLMGGRIKWRLFGPLQ